ncbi:MAG TPA: shikimate dehydrogenase [Clostridiales bacterium]|nr:shikimate dehydrogenase [Clostridiales bacterium]
MNIVHSVTGKTKLLGVIGNPLSHSISPQLHNTLSCCLRIDAVYVPFRVGEGYLEYAVKGLKALDVLGFNVTIPYKNDVINYIDSVSREASLIGAVNTVKNIDGRLYGYNTDAAGFVNSFKEEAGTGFKDKNVVIIGAGGAARAIATGIAFEGAGRISIINRTISRAAEIADIINKNILPVAGYYDLQDNNISEAIKQADIIINTTSLGMYPDINKLPLTIPLNFSTNQIIYDVIYNPKKTRLLQEAEKQGCKAVNGLGMLIYQGIKAYEIWMEMDIPGEIVKSLFEAFREYL